MDVRRSKRIQNQKRQQAHNAEPLAKRKKDAVVAEPNESEVDEETKITDLNADCLEHIFKQLELKDLLNVADSRKSFREGVEQAFTSKYWNRDVQIYIRKVRSNLKIDESGNEIKIYAFGSGLKLLRCFGKFTFTLKIFDNIYKRSQRFRRLELDRYMNEYCTETLKEIAFLNAPKFVIAGLKQPLVNVEKLCIHGSLDLKLSDFNRWFPNLQHLQLDSRLVTDSKCIEVHLPHLRHLQIKQSYPFSPENITTLLRLNPQLQSLRIKSNNDQSVIKSASELPHLEELHIDYNGFRFSDTEEVRFKNVKKFGLDYCMNWPPLKLPLSFEKLEEFSAVISGIPPSGIIQEFISMHPSIKKIHITICGIYISEDLKEKLKEIWSFGHEWRASFKFGVHRQHNMEFERNN